MRRRLNGTSSTKGCNSALQQVAHHHHGSRFGVLPPCASGWGSALIGDTTPIKRPTLFRVLVSNNKTKPRCKRLNHESAAARGRAARNGRRSVMGGRRVTTCLSWQGIRIRKEIRLDQVTSLFLKISFFGVKSPLIYIRMGWCLLSIKQ